MFNHAPPLSPFNIKKCANIELLKKCFLHFERSFNTEPSKNIGIISRVNSNTIERPPTNQLRSSSFFTATGGLTDKKKEYNARKIVGFTMDQMYSVVSDVENYKSFVPFCSKSVVKSRTSSELFGELEIGFPPIIESYTSRVSLVKPRLVKAVCTDGRLFDHLITVWSFNPGLKQMTQSCLIDFYVSFEFKSLLHSQLAHMFFNELVRQMEGAFFREAEKRYGPPSMSVIKIKIPS